QAGFRVRIQTVTVDDLLAMFDDPPHSEVSEEDWEFLRGTLSRILSSASSFYDDYDHRHYEFALGVADDVLNGRDVIQGMAGTAHFLLSPLVEEAAEEAKEFSAETRAQLERIRDTHPEFAELAADLKETTTEFSIEAMARLFDQAKEFY